MKAMRKASFVFGVVMFIVLVSWLVIKNSTPKLFKDVPENHWAHFAVEMLVNAGIISPADDEMFYGERAITHAEMAQAVANLLLKISPSSTADAKKIVDDSASVGDKVIDRYEIAVMLADVYKKVHKDNLAVATKTFKDVPADHWASESVYLLDAEGLMEGYSNGTFRGERTMTRYEAAVLIGKFYGRFSS